MPVWAFDFDGVVVDSARETATAGWKTCQILWPDAYKDTHIPAKVVSDFHTVRPVLETGYESVMLVKILYEGQLSADDLLYKWHSVADQYISSAKTSREELAAAFASVRKQWMDEDVEAWIAAHSFWDDVVETLKKLSNVYIITTKGKDFSLQLLSGAGLDHVIPADNVYGLGSGKKHLVIERLLNEQGQGDRRWCISVLYESRKHNWHLCPKCTFHSVVFVEDRLETLLAAKEYFNSHKGDGNGASDIQADLLLAAWGYNTESDRRRAAEAGIKVVSLDDFRNFANQHSDSSSGYK